MRCESLHLGVGARPASLTCEGMRLALRLLTFLDQRIECGMYVSLPAVRVAKTRHTYIFLECLSMKLEDASPNGRGRRGGQSMLLQQVSVTANINTSRLRAESR